ncbi:hypothetical protein PSPO01_15608 [Paraphaeosphaeria sporulosa]
MTERSAAGKYFEHLPEYSLAICRECRHGVLPSQVPHHLQRHHRVPRKEADSIAEEVGRWAGVIQYASQLEVPQRAVAPTSQLPIYTDGLMCELEPDRCRQVFRSAEVMRKHWQKAHHWSPATRGGRPSQVAQKRIALRSKQGHRRVHCQRLFVQGPGSQYFEVHQPESTPEPMDSETGWAQVVTNMDEAWGNVQKRAKTTIQDGARDEVNPWLERTGWMPYLVGMERPDLLASVEEPKAEEEPVAAAIWEAMDGLARFSQSSVIHRIGIFVRLEAIRTEKHQTRYQPLQPYMDEKSIGEHARPWQQMLMFFWRTQQEHVWKSPKYQFTKRQREAWEAFVKEAGGAAGGEEEDEEQLGATSDDKMTDDADSVVGEMEEAPAAGVGNMGEPETLSSIEKACLAFCITLLNQSITRKEYDSPLVCALAVLGVREDGWKGADQYPPILSAVIKVARFMIVQQALALSKPFKDDSAYESDGDSTQPPARPKGCLQFVAQMMDKFMDDQIKGRFMKPGTRSGVDQQEVMRYMDRVVVFQEKLIVLMHMTGGQPARGLEIMSIRHSNTVKGGHRNVFIKDGKVVFVTRYHKGYQVSGDVKIIHQYLPREVGELVVYYLWLVLPFQQRMEALVWEKEAMSSHMWPADPNGRKWMTDRMREALKRETSVGLSQPLTIPAYREIAIGISRRFLRGSTAFQQEEGDESEAWNEENTAGLIADLQAGHTAHVAGMVYARGIME